MSAGAFRCGHPRTPENSWFAFGRLTLCRECNAAHRARRRKPAGVVAGKNMRFDMAHLAAEYAAGATYEQLAKRLGVARSTIHRHFAKMSKQPKAARARKPHDNTVWQMREEHQQDQIAEVARHAGAIFGLRPGAIWADSHKPGVVRARYAAFRVAWENGAAKAAIGRAFEMDHTTVMYGCRQAIDYAEVLPGYADKLDALRAAVAQSEAQAA